MGALDDGATVGREYRGITEATIEIRLWVRFRKRDRPDLLGLTGIARAAPAGVRGADRALYFTLTFQEPNGRPEPPPRAASRRPLPRPIRRHTEEAPYGHIPAPSRRASRQAENDAPRRRNARRRRAVRGEDDHARRQPLRRRDRDPRAPDARRPRRRRSDHVLLPGARPGAQLRGGRPHGRLRRRARVPGRRDEPDRHLEGARRDPSEPRGVRLGGRAGRPRARRPRLRVV